MGTDALWPIRPPPIPGESFSSWFARLATGNTLSPSEFYRIASPGARLYRADLDRALASDLVENLERHTGVRARDIRLSSFALWRESLAADEDRNGKLTWLPAAGTARSKHAFGLQCCPLCLDSEPIAHFRLGWRISYRTVCDDHHVGLLDRCPGCQAPIQPLNLPVATRSIALCWQCGADLRRAPTQSVPRDNPGFRVQRRLDRVVRDGWAILGGSGPYHAAPFFQLTWRVYRSVATGRFAEPLRIEALRMLGSSDPPSRAPAYKELERLPPRARRWLLGLTGALLQDWPDRYIAACRAAGMAARHLVKDRSRTPFAFLEPVLEALNGAPTTLTPEEFTHAKDYLCRRGIPPTRKALGKLLGGRFPAHETLLEPAPNHAPYRGGRYWKLDGVSPEIRERAKRAARRDGETIGPWVEQALREILTNRDREHNIRYQAHNERE